MAANEFNHEGVANLLDADYSILRAAINNLRAYPSKLTPTEWQT